MNDAEIKKLEAELRAQSNAHIAGYPGPRRDVADLLDRAADALSHRYPQSKASSVEGKVR